MKPLGTRVTESKGVNPGGIGGGRVPPPQVFSMRVGGEYLINSPEFSTFLMKSCFLANGKPTGWCAIHLELTELWLKRRHLFR